MTRRIGWAVPMSTAAWLVITILVGGCGVRPQAQPEPLPTRVLDNLGRPSPAPTASATSPAPTGAQATEDVEVFFLRGSRLIAVRRQVPRGGPLDSRIQVLVAGPTSAESDDGVATAIPTDADFNVRVLSKTAVTDAPEELTALGGTEQVLALAQLVYTATAVDGITGVQLTDHGRPIEVPTGSGRLVAGPVDRQDYAGLAPS